MLAVTRTDAQSSPVPLYQSSSVCLDRNTTLLCTLTDDKEYRLEDFRWKGLQEVVIKNASRLILKEPLCEGSKVKKVTVHNAARVTTETNDNNCWQHLDLHNSRHVVIEGGVNHLRMFSSETSKIILRRGSFHLEDTQVGEANLIVDNGSSRMTSSTTIKLVKRLLVNGSAVLNMENTSLGKLEKLIYDSDNSATLKNVTVDSVASRGFQVVRGDVTLDNVFIKYMAPLGLVVQDATLTVQHCEIESTVHESIFVSDGATIIFENVTIGQDPNITFTFSGVIGELYPLAFLEHRSIATSGWVAIAVFAGVTVGATAGFVAMVILQRRFKDSRLKKDTAKDTEQTTFQSALNPNSYEHKGQFTPVPSRLEQEVGPPIELTPRTHKLQRPPVATPNLSKPDERNALPLPPPPPPPEELYDEMQFT